MPGLGERSRLLAQQLGNGNHEDDVFRRLDLSREEEIALLYSPDVLKKANLMKQLENCNEL